MDKLLNQDWRDPFLNNKIGDKPYGLISAGSGPKNIEMPNGQIISCSDLKKQLNYPQLFAWNLEGKDLLEWAEYLYQHPECPTKLVVDSGAYSMWSRGKEFDMDKYIDFLNSNHVIETCFWAAEADVIPGRMGFDPTEEERAAAPEQSWENFLYMIDRVKIPKKIVPIFHMGEDFKHLKRMLSYRYQDNTFIKFIGISPRNDVHVNEKAKWYEETWRIIYEECAKLGREIPLTHNFGMTTLSLMEQYPSYTSDSTSWLRSGSFGNIMIIVNGKIKTIYVSNRNLNSDEHIYHQNQAIKDTVETWCKKFGYGLSIDALVNDDKGNYRMVWNLLMLNEWRNNFNYEGSQEFKQDLW